MKGGLGPYDSTNIGMEGTYSFQFPAYQDMLKRFKLYVFGSDEQRVAWETLLTECKDNEVPVYILSAGDKIGIIRMLQLMKLDDKFEEVLCTNESPFANPETIDGSHNFQGQTKYDVISTILREREIAPFGCLMDDNPENAIDKDKAITIEFVNVNTVVDKKPTAQPNPFYRFIAANKSLQLQPLIASRGLADVGVIIYVTELVKNGTYKIVFIDFDQTFQQWSGAIPFWRDNVRRAFRDEFPFTVKIK
jgi:hypothetical protein